MKILITGVAGLLGSRLSDYIVENHPDVHIVGIDDMSGGYKENVNSKVELWEMNLVNGNIEECFERYQFIIRKKEYINKEELKENYYK